ncbi:MAG TPA: chorismate-binding protein [Blattabacteriaceae bacterium]
MSSIFLFKTFKEKYFSENVNPVNLYLKLRDYFPKSLLFEKICASILCIDPISEIWIDKNQANISYPNDYSESFLIGSRSEVQRIIDNFFKKFRSENIASPYSGFYGYFSYESIQYFENISLKSPIKYPYRIPQIRLKFYINLIIFHTSCEEIIFVKHNLTEKKGIYSIKKLNNFLKKTKKNYVFSFKISGQLDSNISNEEHKNMIIQARTYCLYGDIFQIVLSRQFSHKFIGDEFNVYLSLREINPSPYLFYFDYGNYKIFGSSPEAQLIVKKNLASINPIAGTITRSVNKMEESIVVQKLLLDPKENSEHIMLVDLARNDLSRNSSKVRVESFKKLQYFSHVLHMVSRVYGKLYSDISTMRIFRETFPSGTLSGAPKYRAIKIIDQIENQHRGIYGGAIGFLGLDGGMDSSIIIRSFLSKENTLFFQAGSGILYESKEDNEVQEVKNKLSALFKSINFSKKNLKLWRVKY